MDANLLSSAIRTAGILFFGTALVSGVSQAATPSAFKFSGALAGSVRDVAGIPQMGAVVHLFNRYERLIEKAVTNANGEFGFASLLPETYSIRVTLASFVPALKRNIAIQPGMKSVLAINLASMLSSVELIYSVPNSGTLMNEDWKWVLRSTMTTRPVLRILQGLDPLPNRGLHEEERNPFTDTRGIVRVSAGEASPYTPLTSQPDLGTTFALATSLYGKNQLQFSGNIGYAANSELPTAGFRTSFSRSDLQGPEVKLTMQQVSLPLRGAPLVNSQMANTPALRTMSVTVLERLEISDGIDLDYGASLDSVAFLERLNYISPFARLSYRLGDNGTVDVGYSSGAPPVELLNAGRESETGLQDDLNALSVLPRVSLRDGTARVQRTQNVEVGYRVERGTRTYQIGFYHEAVSNGSLTLSLPGGFSMFERDLLPELSSNSSVFNIGSYSRTGYTASVAQRLGETYTATVAVGRGGVLGTDDAALQSTNADELRSMIRSAQRHWVRGILSGVAPVTGTRFITSYEWTDYRSLTPGHVYLTQKIQPETGLNVRIRQPLPIFGVLPGRIEATAELRNLLAQGYLPITTADGRRLILAHSPRAVRGGFSFIF